MKLITKPSFDNQMQLTEVEISIINNFRKLVATDQNFISGWMQGCIRDGEGARIQRLGLRLVRGAA